MRRLIEVVFDDKGDVEFKTDLNEKDIPVLPFLAAQLCINMVTRLWDGNERMVPAAISSLAIADLAASVNRQEMIAFLDESSSDVSDMISEFFDQNHKNWMPVQSFVLSGEKTSKMKN